MAERLMDHILPKNGTQAERVLSSQVQRLLDLDIPIRDLWNPWRCPASLLPYLAWALSVDIWHTDWPDAKKRSVIANAFRHHKIKGTLGAIKTYAELEDATIRRAIVPPAKVFSGPTLTRSQREAWLSGLPQVRVWRQFDTAPAGHRVFSSGFRLHSFYNAPADTDHPQGHHKKFLHPDQSAERTRRRARWVVHGVETDSRVENFESYFRVFGRGIRQQSVFCNTSMRRKGKFLLPSTSADRVVTIEPVSISTWRTAVGRRLTPVTSEPELVAQSGLRGRSVYPRDILRSKHYFLPSKAPTRLFERYAVFDGSSASKRPSIQFMGFGRYGIPPHTAEIKIEIRDKQKPWKAGEGIATARKRFWIPHDDSRFSDVRRAVSSAKRLTDTVLLDTTTRPGFIAGIPFSAGDTFIA
jgi:hypothetical protein